MKPRRRLTRLEWTDEIYRQIQLTRLRGIGSGQIEPRYPQEFYFLMTLRLKPVIDLRDFMLPRLLYMAEHELWKDAQQTLDGRPLDPDGNCSSVPEPSADMASGERM